MESVIILGTARIPIDTQTLNLLKYIRENPYCEITLKVQGGVPVMIEKSVEKIKL